MQKDLDEIHVVDLSSEIVPAKDYTSEFIVMRQTIQIANGKKYQLDFYPYFGNIYFADHYTVFYDSTTGSDVYEEVPRDGKDLMVFLQDHLYYTYVCEHSWDDFEAYFNTEMSKRVNGLSKDAKTIYPGLREIKVDYNDRVRLIFSTNAEISNVLLSDVELEIKKYKKRVESGKTQGWT